VDVDVVRANLQENSQKVLVPWTFTQGKQRADLQYDDVCVLLTQSTGCVCRKI
jgi:hypothetical protein